MSLQPPPPSGPPADPLRPAAPELFNGATVRGFTGDSRMRHPWEIPLLVVGVAFTLLLYAIWIAMIIYAIVLLASGRGDTVEEELANAGIVTQLFLLLLALPFLIWIARALMYAQLRVSSVRMSPTQFPEGYRMVSEAASQFGLRRVPDAYMSLGNGVINASAALIGQIPLLGPAYSRTQEYTADNFGYFHCPTGAPGAMAVLAAGKYLNANVNVNEFADRAATERGLWVHIANWQASHPVLTWRLHALRDRSRPGHLWFRPGFRGTSPGAVYRGPLPPGSDDSLRYPTPADALVLLDRAALERPPGFDNQFGRFPGVDYAGQPPTRRIQLSAPLISTGWMPPAVTPNVTPPNQGPPNAGPPGGDPRA